MKKLVWSFSVACISVLCTTSVFAFDISQRMVEGVVDLVVMGLSFEVAWHLLKSFLLSIM